MVAVKPADVDRYTTRPDPRHRLILIFGPDAGAVSERALSCAAALLGRNNATGTIDRIDGDEWCDDPSRLSDEASSFNLFGEKRVILVRAGSRTLDKSALLLLENDTTLHSVIIQAGDLQARHILRAMCEKSPVAATIACYADSSRDVMQAIEDTFERYSLRAEPGIKQSITQFLGADRLLTRSELEKLAMYVGSGGVVDADAVMLSLAAAAPSVGDRITDAAFAGEAAATHAALNAFRNSGESTDAQLAAALRHGYSLLRAVDERDRSVPLDDIMRSARIFWKRQDAFKRHIGLWRTEPLRSALTSLHAVSGRIRRQAHLAGIHYERAILALTRQAQSQRTTR